MILDCPRMCDLAIGTWQQGYARTLCCLAAPDSLCPACRLVAGPPAQLCTSKTNVTVGGAAVEVQGAEGEEVYTAAEALHPGQEMT